MLPQADFIPAGSGSAGIKSAFDWPGHWGICFLDSIVPGQKEDGLCPVVVGLIFVHPLAGRISGDKIGGTAVPCEDSRCICIIGSGNLIGGIDCADLVRMDYRFSRKTAQPVLFQFMN